MKIDPVKHTFLAKIDHNANYVFFEKGPDLSEAVLPESPGYALNMNANFYFLGNINRIFKYSKMEN